MVKAKTKNKKKCKTGWQCGLSCISKKKSCRKNLKSSDGKAILQRYINLAKAASNAIPLKITPRGGGGESESSAKEKKPKLTYKDIPIEGDPNIKPGDIVRGMGSRGGNTVDYNVGENDIQASRDYIQDTLPLKKALNTNIEDVLKRTGKDLSYVKGDSDFMFLVNDDFSMGKLKPVEGLKPREVKRRVAMAAKFANQELLDNISDGTIVTNSPLTADGNGEQRIRNYKKAGFGLIRDDEFRPEMAAIKIDGKFHPLERGNFKDDDTANALRKRAEEMDAEAGIDRDGLSPEVASILDSLRDLSDNNNRI